MPKLRGISTVVVLSSKGDVLTVAPEFANARYMNRNIVLPFLRAWTPVALAVQ